MHDPTQLVDAIVISEQMNEDREIWFRAKRPLRKDAHFHVQTISVLGC